MPAHLARQQVREKPSSHHSSPFQTPRSTSKMNYLSRPHSSHLVSIATPIELFFLFLALLALLALVIWLAWIAISHCIKFAREKMDDLDVGKRTKKNMKKAEEAPKKMFRVGIGMGRATVGFVKGFVKGERQEEGRGREGERRALVGGGPDERVVAGVPRGVYIQGYGYDRERYGDGANDSSSTRSTSVSIGHRDCHRNDGDGHCGLKERRRSMDS